MPRCFSITGLSLAQKPYFHRQWEATFCSFRTYFLLSKFHLKHDWFFSVFFHLLFWRWNSEGTRKEGHIYYPDIRWAQGLWSSIILYSFWLRLKYSPSRLALLASAADAHSPCTADVMPRHSVYFLSYLDSFESPGYFSHPGASLENCGINGYSPVLGVMRLLSVLPPRSSLICCALLPCWPWHFSERLKVSSGYLLRINTEFFPLSISGLLTCLWDFYWHLSGFQAACRHSQVSLWIHPFFKMEKLLSLIWVVSFYPLSGLC